MVWCLFLYSSTLPRQTPLVNSRTINTSKHLQVPASISAVFSAAIPPSVPSEKSMSVTIDCAQKAILRPVPVRELHCTAAHGTCRRTRAKHKHNGGGEV
ncbi:hypothetical protein V8C40DRAFT_249054 [Trichoderma camerunense]